MAVYTIHEMPNPPSDRVDRAEALVFVRDGFSWLATLFAPFWLAAQGLWLSLLAYIAVTVALSSALTAAGIEPGWVFCALLAVNIWVGFEASELRRLQLSMNGWTTLGAVSGRDQQECERRFFEGWIERQPILARHDANAPTTQAEPAVPARGLIGRLLAGGA